MFKGGEALTKIAVRLRRLALIVGATSIIGTFAWWLTVDLQTILGENYDAQPISPHTRSLMHVAGLLIELLPLAVQLWIVTLLYRFASEIERGNVFDTARLYRQLGFAAIALALADVIAGSLARAVLTLIANPHVLSIGLALTSGDVGIILVGAILIATSSFIAMAQAAQRENDEFV